MDNSTKPCPFCGEIPKVSTICRNGLSYYWIECENEKCRIQPSTDWVLDKRIAKREWNRRSPHEDH